MPLVELQSFQNDIVSDSPHMGRVSTTLASTDSQRGNLQGTKHPLDNHDDEGSNQLQCGEGSSHERGRDNRGGMGRPPSNTSRIDFSAIGVSISIRERRVPSPIALLSILNGRVFDDR
jgi:hypothetical protein